MKSIWKRDALVLAFLAGLAALLALLSPVFSPKDNTEAAGMEEVRANAIAAEPEDTIDVLFLGDSIAYAAFSPMQLWEENGYTSYVCATSGQILSYTYTMLQRAFESQSPKLVVLETDNLYQSVGVGAMGLDELSRLLPVFRYHDRWKTLSLRDLDFHRDNTYFSTGKGSWSGFEAKAYTGGDYMSATDECAAIPKMNQLYLALIQRFCASRGAQLLLVSAPSPANWSMARHNGVQALADRLGLSYLDLNLAADEMGIDWETDTLDYGDHLNYYGQAKATRALAGYLAGLDLLADHRSDSAYSDPWNRDLAAYYDELAGRNQAPDHVSDSQPPA